jgi:predicted GIY-YIG superfamily endonuclease
MPKTNRQKKSLTGTAYLFHFAEKYAHAQHYLGFAEVLENRLAEHFQGRGSRLTQVVTSAGIKIECVRTWENVTRSDERKLKNRRDARALCPICKAERRLEQKQAAMRRRQNRKNASSN